MAGSSRILPDFPLANLLELDDGRTVEWEVIGEGEPLVWIEGGPGFWAHLARPDVTLLADRFTCHLVNAPGCGRTSPPREPETYDLDSHVRFFEEVRQALGLGQATVMGHSWGGLVAVAWAVAFPDAVRRLIVVDGYIGEASVDPDAATRSSDLAVAHGHAVMTLIAEELRCRAAARLGLHDVAIRSLASSMDLISQGDLDADEEIQETVLSAAVELFAATGDVALASKLELPGAGSLIGGRGSFPMSRLLMTAGSRPTVFS